MTKKPTGNVWNLIIQGTFYLSSILLYEKVRPKIGKVCVKIFSKGLQVLGFGIMAKQLNPDKKTPADFDDADVDKSDFDDADVDKFDFDDADVDKSDFDDADVDKSDFDDADVDKFDFDDADVDKFDFDDDFMFFN